MYCTVEMALDQGVTSAHAVQKDFTQQFSLFVFLILFYSKKATHS